MPFRESGLTSNTTTTTTYTRSEIIEIIYSRYNLIENFTGCEENKLEYHLMMIEALDKFGRERFPRQVGFVKKAIRLIINRHFNSSMKEYCAKFIPYLDDSDDSDDSDSDESV